MATSKLKALDGEDISIYDSGNVNKGRIFMDGTAVRLTGTGTHVVIEQGHNLLFDGTTATIGGRGSSIISLGLPGDTVALNVTGVTYNFGTIAGDVTFSNALRVNGTFRTGTGKHAKSFTFAKGTTTLTQTWTHNYGTTDYAIGLSCNSPEPHIYWSSKTSTSITICIDDTPYSGDIVADAVLIGW